MRTMPEIRIGRRKTPAEDVAVDLKISQLVDVPSMHVSALLPEDVLTT
jgi:hypothetical protein